MRIIGGDWRRRQLKAPPGDATRPTADRVRETLFSMLASRIGSFDGLSVADLFAGSGALGLEALSRGAEHCLFVENDAAAVKALKDNIATLDAQRRSSVQAASVLQLGPAKEPTDLILLDPPYGTAAGQVALDRLARLGWVGPSTWVSLETAHDEEIKLRTYEIESERKVGKAKLTLLRLANADDEAPE